MFIPSDSHRREVKRILRSGERTATWRRTHAERFLGGCRLLDAIDAVAWRHCRPQTAISFAMAYHYAPVAYRILYGESPFLSMLRGTYRRTYGRWR